MPSFAARIIDRGFRLITLPRMDTQDKLVSHARTVINLVRPPAMLPPSVTVRKTTIGTASIVGNSVPAMCVSAPAPRATVLYIHGGAFVCGKFSTYSGLCGQLAHHLNARVFWIDYRLAPESPFPAASNDAFHSYQALANEFTKDPLAIMGDSAGGNLTLSTLLRVRDALALQEGGPTLRLPSCAVAMSAITDFATSSPSRTANNRSDCSLTSQIVDLAGQAYLSGHDPTDPYASPLCGDLHDLPPLFLSVSDAEVVRDDSYRFTNKARRAGVRVHLLNRWDAPHAWPVLYSLMPEARNDVRAIIRFAKQHLNACKQMQSSILPLHAASANAVTQ